MPGIIFLIGKISSSTPGSYVSCCVRVENVQRSIFIVPRSTNLESGEDVTMSDVYHEIQNVFSELKIFEFQVKSVVKDFPFTGKNEESISGEFLNVLYPAKCKET